MCIRDRDISPEALEQNVLSIYAKLYHKYEADKQFIPEGNLMEVKKFLVDSNTVYGLRIK